MRYIELDQDLKEKEFALRAARYFKSHPECHSYTDVEIVPGCYFAIRWDCADTSVAVLKLDNEFVPTVFVQMIKQV